MKLSIAFMAGRREPHLDWFLEGLADQVVAGDNIDLLVIDAHAHERPLASSTHEIGARIGRICDLFLSVRSPKPTIWQGPHRITAEDWWAKSNAINTALVLARYGYIAFLDDCCRLGPEWLASVRRGERARASAIAGSYEKLERGTVTMDHRRSIAPSGKLNCGGGWLFGCTYALPLDWALAVNGAEEGCDSMGSEDSIFGLMLSNAGYRIDYVPTMSITQERPESGPGPSGGSIPIRRTDKGASPHDKSHSALARFGKRKRTEFTPDLIELRAKLAAGGEWPIPDPNHEWRDWYDGELIREMT